jgi:hypothetical protein
MHTDSVKNTGIFESGQRKNICDFVLHEHMHITNFRVTNKENFLISYSTINLIFSQPSDRDSMIQI